MSKIYEEITAKGLTLPNIVLAQWGWEEGTRVIVESQNGTIVIKPEEITARDIARRACIFLLKKVGDATAVKTPIRDGNKWRVTVVVPYLKKDIGRLTYTLDGALIPEESDTPEQLTEKADED